MDKLIRMFSEDANRAFLDNSSFPWINRIEENWMTVRDEFDGVMRQQDRIPNVEDISQDGNLGADRKPMSRGAEWKWFFLYGYGHKVEANCARCPKTTELIESVPGMQGAIFAILAPGKHIPPHQGLYKGLLRYHLGVRIPGAPGMCRIKVADETRAWEQGRSFIFDDTFTHEVWNESNVQRVVFMIDVERPLPAPIAMLNRFILRWISSTSYINDAIDKVKAAAEVGMGTAAMDAGGKI
ncbi:MAG TPA: aspartyl/asparaginyl beta-hydroxylase domain-containing protein [Terriglobales bacterium]|nr:aspartyl/asparaginyl beta-hydroxylase domain-containing protein [Terriglobales bacterium]